MGVVSVQQLPFPYHRLRRGSAPSHHHPRICLVLFGRCKHDIYQCSFTRCGCTIKISQLVISRFVHFFAIQYSRQCGLPAPGSGSGHFYVDRVRSNTYALQEGGRGGGRCRHCGRNDKRNTPRSSLPANGILLHCRWRKRMGSSGGLSNEF